MDGEWALEWQRNDKPLVLYVHLATVSGSSCRSTLELGSYGRCFASPYSPRHAFGRSLTRPLLASLLWPRLITSASHTVRSASAGDLRPPTRRRCQETTSGGDERRDTRHAGRPPSLGTVSLAGPFSSVTSRLTPPSLRLTEDGVKGRGKKRKGPTWVRQDEPVRELNGKLSHVPGLTHRFHAPITSARRMLVPGSLVTSLTLHSHPRSRGERSGSERSEKERNEPREMGCEGA